MHTLKLTDQELNILKIIGEYAVSNDADIFVADDLVTDDDQAQALLYRLNHKIQNL